MSKIGFSTDGKEKSRIGQITLEELRDGNNGKTYQFIIPTYQRGYRWRSIHVNALIKDLSSIESDENYCLQPIVLQRIGSEEENKFRVVDGQQRLTTIMLLLRTWSESAPWSMTPENGQQTDDRISEACKRNTENIAQSKKQYIALKLKQVFFIWYLLEENEDGHAAFQRLNSGKIPLTSSELIRAKLLGPCGCVNPYEIAAEWERIEQRLRDDRFWFMFNSRASETFTRIDRLFEIITNTEGKVELDRLKPYYEIEKRIGEKNDPEAIWEEVLNLFWMLEQCYNDVERYHYIGWLRHFSGAKFSTLYELYKRDKLNFPQNLQKIIIGQSGKITVNHDDAKKIRGLSLVPGDGDLGQLIESNFRYENDPKVLRSFFVLFNIESLNQKIRNLDADQKRVIEYERFPFDWFQKTQWNIEHIDSHTENAMEDPDEQVEWALETYIEQNDDSNEDILFWLSQQLNDEGYKKRIDDWIIALDFKITLPEQCEKHIEFKEIYDRHRGARIAEEQKNLPWNLTLLDEHTNKSYQNAIFPRKRRRVIAASKGPLANEDIAVFIPFCTLNVFTKFYTESAVKITEWTPKDAECYKDTIIKTFKKLIEIAEI